MKSTASYTPTDTDLAWARQTIATLRDGAILAYPNTKMIYSISHKDKTLTLQNPEQLASFDSFVIHYQTIDTFHGVGYTVLPPKDEEEINASTSL